MHATTSYLAVLDKSNVMKIDAKVSQGSVDYSIKMDPYGQIELAVTVSVVKAKKSSNVDVNMVINWKIRFLPTYWQDHPEVKTMNDRFMTQDFL